jgi:hypothetical protein
MGTQYRLEKAKIAICGLRLARCHERLYRISTAAPPQRQDLRAWDTTE